MKINIIGGGPAGLYFALLMKKLDPAHAITVVERDGPNDTFGWGIVFSDTAFTFLQDGDDETFEQIVRAAETWGNVDILHRGVKTTVWGNSFSGIARLKFLNILHARCESLGVDLRFHTNIDDLTDWLDCDLLVGADGANSLVRQAYSGFFQSSVDVRQNKYMWLGTNQLFHGLTMGFRETDAGLFIAHAYKFSPTASTFIVECPPETWLKAGFDRLTDEETCKTLAEIFKEELGGQPLLSNNFVKWLNFPLVKNKRWYHRNVVLLGDSAHTAHFSIGSGTRLALESAIALAESFAEHAAVEAALPAFQAARKPRVDRFQAAAYQSLAVLENVQAHMHLDPVPFTYQMMTRSRRVGYGRLKRGDPRFIARYDHWRKQQPPVSGPIPAEYLDLFEKKTIAHLASLLVNGTPHVTPVWVDYDGQHILINSAKGRQKDINMEKRRHVAIEIPDPDDSNRYLAIRGEVVEITELGADEHLNQLAQRYLDKEAYPPSMRFPGEVRRLYKILPKHVSAWDPFG